VPGNFLPQKLDQLQKMAKVKSPAIALSPASPVTSPMDFPSMPPRTTSAPASLHEVAIIAEARLGASSHAELRSIQCKFHEGSLVLDGRLGTFFQKQLAQEIVAKIEGVKQIVNQIEVVGWAT
jgi:hypothetical protein